MWEHKPMAYQNTMHIYEAIESLSEQMLVAAQKKIGINWWSLKVAVRSMYNS